jgi:hypothetical protein
MAHYSVVSARAHRRRAQWLCTRSQQLCHNSQQLCWRSLWLYLVSQQRGLHSKQVRFASELVCLVSDFQRQFPR